MRIDPKFFNLFVVICAVIAVIVIVLSTIRYSQKQIINFERNLSEIHLDTLAFRSYLQSDSLYLSEITSPIIIHFWSTWSEKSKRVSGFLSEYKNEHSDLVIVAAAVRDREEQILEYIHEENFNFLFVEGTGFYQQLFVPGVPSQIFIDKHGRLFDTHIGDEIQEIRIKLNNLMKDE